MTSRQKTQRSRWGSVLLRGRTRYVRFRWPRGGRTYVRSVGPDREDARNRLRELETALRRGVPVRTALERRFCAEARARSFRQVVELYLAQGASRKAPKTLAAEGPRLKQLGSERWARLPLTEIREADVERWLDRLRDRRKL